MAVRWSALEMAQSSPRLPPPSWPCTFSHVYFGFAHLLRWIYYEGLPFLRGPWAIVCTYCVVANGAYGSGITAVPDKLADRRKSSQHLFTRATASQWWYQVLLIRVYKAKVLSYTHLLLRVTFLRWSRWFHCINYMGNHGRFRTVGLPFLDPKNAAGIGRLYNLILPLQPESRFYFARVQKSAQGLSVQWRCERRKREGYEWT